MSLRKSVLEIADNIEEDANKLHAQDVSLHVLLLSYARQMRAAATASEAVESYRDRTPSRQEIAQLKLVGEQEERRLAGMAEVVGGDFDGDFAPIDPAMPVEAKMLLGGQVYVLMGDGKLHFSDVETEKIRVAHHGASG